MDQEEGLPAAVQKSPYHPAVIPGTRVDRFSDVEVGSVEIIFTGYAGERK